MTPEEADGLSPGDAVLFRPLSARRGDPPRRGVVVEGGKRGVSGRLYRLRVRADGLDPRGLRLRPQYCHVRDAFLVEKYDPLSANVFADWLEEMGECRAAAKLREAFPLAPARVVK